MKILSLALSLATLLLATSTVAADKKPDNLGAGEHPGDGWYNYVFPDGLANYKAGTTVLARDGNVYACKPWPASGYCKQWTATMTHFEPGKGTHWTMAWDRK